MAKIVSLHQYYHSTDIPFLVHALKEPRFFSSKHNKKRHDTLNNIYRGLSSEHRLLSLSEPTIY